MEDLLYYQAFGLTFASPRPLSGWYELATRPEGAVTLTFAPSPGSSLGPRGWSRLSDQSIILNVPTLARYCIQPNQIDIYSEANAPEREILLYLMGSAMAALLYMREYTLFHCATINILGSGVAFSGANGAGKSTLAASLATRGHIALSDDIAALNIADPELLQPGYPRAKLNEASLKHLGVDNSTLASVGGVRQKYAFPFENDNVDPCPWHSLFVLEYGTALRIEPLSKPATLAALMHHSFRRPLLRILDRERHQFQRCSALAHTVKGYRLIRPRQLNTMDAVLDQLEAVLKAG